MINEKGAVEEHDTDKGFYKQMSEVQHTLHKNVYFFILRITVELCCTLMSAVLFF